MMEHKLNETEAREYLNSLGFKFSKQYLGQIRRAGKGPTYYRFGNMCFYNKNDINAWVESHRQGAPS